MEIWLCSHGESIAEINKILQGHQSGELSERGFIQSKLLAFRLSFVKFNEIISSDLDRTIQTTKQILSYQENTPVEFDFRLRERSYGILEGKSMSLLRTEATKRRSNMRDFRPEGGENCDDVMERSREIINDIIIKYVKKDYDDSIHNVVESTNIKIKINDLKIVPFYNKVCNDKNLNENTNIIIKEDNNSNSIKQNILLSKNLHNEYEDEFLNKDLETLFTNIKFQNKINKFYKGCNLTVNIPRVLIITHQGFLNELINSIRKIKNLKINTTNESNASGIFIIKIFCVNCGSICYSKDKSCLIQFNIVLQNDIEHLNF